MSAQGEDDAKRIRDKVETLQARLFESSSARRLSDRLGVGTGAHAARRHLSSVHAASDLMMAHLLTALEHRVHALVPVGDRTQTNWAPKVCTERLLSHSTHPAMTMPS
eukprot:3175759-Pleurochrysis_carterae.AAC.2